MQGRSVSDFVVAAVHQAAQRTIADAQIIIQLSLHDQERIVAALLDPPPMPDGMAKASHGPQAPVVQAPPYFHGFDRRHLRMRRVDQQVPLFGNDDRRHPRQQRGI
jgi:Protein of unknown function (DUF1778)